MTLEEDIQETFKADAESIIEDHYARLSGKFRYHDDGSINLVPEVEESSGHVRMLTYIIAKRFMFEAGDADSPEIEYDYFYRVFDVKDTTVRDWAQKLRNKGFIETENGNSFLIPENLPRAIDMIEDETD